MDSVVRASFRHVVLSEYKQQHWYESLNAADVATDNDPVACSARFLAYVHAGGGASTVAVIPLSSTGKNHIPLSASTYQLPVLRGHTGAVADLHFSPVDDCRVATCGADQTVRVWTLPAAGLNADVTECGTAHVGAAATGVRWHPCARDLFAVCTTVGVQLWDATALDAPAVALAGEGAPLPSPAGPASEYKAVEWDYEGARLAVVSSDHLVRIVDARARTLEAEFRPHKGRRSVRVAWAGRRDWLVTTGCGAMQEREVALWRVDDLRSETPKPLARARLDTSVGAASPLYDADTDLLFVLAKGSCAVRCFEVSDLKPFLHAVQAFAASTPQRCAALLPKRACDLMGREVARILRLTDASTVVPLRCEVPRKRAAQFHSDLFPPTASATPSYSAAAWLEGNAGPRDQAFVVDEQVTDTGVPTRAVSAEKGVAGEDGGEEEATESPAAQGDAPVAPAPAAAGAAVGGADASAADRQSQRISRFLGPTSRFKHVYGQEAKRDLTFFNARPSVLAGDSGALAASPRYFAYPTPGGGGPVVVHPLSRPGKLSAAPHTVAGHRGDVVSLSFSPLDDCLLFTGSEDCHVKAWRLPADGMTDSWGPEQAAFDLSGSERPVRALAPHPSAAHVLASGSMDASVRLWDVEATEERSAVAGAHEGGVLDLSWSSDGALVLSAGRDATAAVLDPRAGAVTQRFSPHAAAKGIRVQWLGASPHVVTTGFAADAMREFAVWDVRSLDKPVARVSVDRTAGLLQPLYDEDTGLLFLTAKGEVAIRYYDLQTAAEGATPEPLFCNQWSALGRAPTSGIALLPKRVNDVANVEIARILRLTSEAVEPVHFHVPRSEQLKTFFQDDLFPPAPTGMPGTTAGDWFGGYDAPQPRATLCPEGMTPLSEKPAEKQEVILDELRKEDERKQAAEDAFQRFHAMAAEKVEATGGRLPCQGTGDQSDMSDWSDDDEE